MILLLAARWVWTAAAVLGVILGVRSVIESSHDLAARRSLGQNGYLELTGKMMRRTALVQSGCFLLFLTIGIAASVSPKPPDLRGGLISWALVLIELALALGLEWNLRDRKKIRDRYNGGDK